MPSIPAARRVIARLRVETHAGPAGRRLDRCSIVLHPTDHVNCCEMDHLALFYRADGEFMAGTRDLVHAGLERGERVLVAVPGAKLAAMRVGLNGRSEHVTFWDMNELGRNPGRIIPAVRDWVAGAEGRRCRFIAEPIWPGRSASEIVEATRHEALLNVAFRDAPVTILCPYDASRLDRSVLLDAERTHPHLLRCAVGSVAGGSSSEHYADPLELWRGHDWPLPDPSRSPVSHVVGFELAETRAFAARHLRAAGLHEDRLRDVVLAVDEAATNALVHGAGAVELRIWRDGDRVICEVSDHGCLEDPLAGRRRPLPDWPGGRGVWLMNQLCDLVELRPIDGGTVVRLHVDLADTDGRALANPRGRPSPL